MVIDLFHLCEFLKWVLFILQPRQNLLSAAGRIGEASHDIMKQVGDEDDVDKAFQVNDLTWLE